MEERKILANRYQLIRKIGSGGMAVVYQAYDTALDRPVAIKLLREEYADDPDFIRRFQKEAKAVARLSHQNIVHIFDFGESDGLTYLVMEYVEGYTLKDIISKYGPLPINQVLDYSIQLCNGMAQAHSQQIVHKDIKPHNIMIDRNHVVKITDFGIAQAMNNLTITHNKGILGSAHYFSPEQARGDYVDFESDIYSLGVVMYEMVTGHVPFTGDNPVTVALKHMQERPTALLEQRADIPIGLERIILKALEKEPKHRFQSMQEMATALMEVQLLLEEHGAAGEYVVPEVLRNAEEESLPRKEYPYANTAENRSDLEDTKDHTRIMGRGYLQEEETEDAGTQTKPKAKRKKNTVLLIAGILVLFFGTFGVVQGLMSRGEVEVPDLEDKTILEAEELLSEASLKIKVEDETYDDTIEKDHIISQDPKAGSRVKEGREISVVLSLGANSEEIPDLSGRTESEAKVLLENLGFSLGSVTEQESDEQPEGRIFWQSVNAGESADTGTSVDVRISKGASDDMVSVPSLTGKSLEEAKSILNRYGLSCDVKEVSSEDFAASTVVQQKPASGKTVEKGTSVELTVSSGPATSTEKSGESEKSAEFDLIIPEDGHVVATLKDSTGSSKLLEKDCVAGERVQQSFLYQGDGVVTITCNGSVILEKKF